MRKLLFAGITTLAFAFQGSAQIDAGTMMAGGSASFNNRISNGNSFTSLVIQPQFGFAFADNFIAGAWFNISSFSSTTSWGVSPFLRYYFNNFFVQGGYGYNRTGDISSSVVDGEIGYAMFFNDNVALEPALYYNQYLVKNGKDPIDIGLKIGFQIYFNR